MRGSGFVRGVRHLSRSIRSVGRLLTSGLQVVALYAGVRAALRTEAIHRDKVSSVASGTSRSGGGPKSERLQERLESRTKTHGRSEASAKPRSSAVQAAQASAREAISVALVPRPNASTSSRGRTFRGSAERTYRELYEEAKRQGVRGRSGMSKAALEAALSLSNAGASVRS
jgi:hypothetical protein